MNDDVRTASEFCARWPVLTRAEIADHFTDDAVYVNIPYPGEIVGGEAISQVLLGVFLQRFSRVDARVHHAVAAGGLVMVERTESFTPKDGAPFDLPVVGVFEMRHGKFCAWRDYFDKSMLKVSF